MMSKKSGRKPIQVRVFRAVVDARDHVVETPTPTTPRRPLPFLLLVIDEDRKGARVSTDAIETSWPSTSCHHPQGRLARTLDKGLAGSAA